MAMRTSRFRTGSSPPLEGGFKQWAPPPSSAGSLAVRAEKAGSVVGLTGTDAAPCPSLLRVNHGERSILLMQHHLHHASQAKQVADSVHQHLDSGSIDMIELNLEQMETLTSSALNELIGLNNRAKACGVRLVLTNLADNLRDIFAITRLERMFELG